MSFLFVVETGAGLSYATSYCSVEYADEYFEIQTSASGWFDLDDTSKEQLLALATRYLDNKVDWRGAIVSATQALRWPRSGAATRDQMIIGSNVIPRAVKDATCELARFLITNDPAAPQDTDAFKRITVDVVEIEFQDDTTQPKIPSAINAILKGIGRFNSSGGGGSGRILRA